MSPINIMIVVQLFLLWTTSLGLVNGWIPTTSVVTTKKPSSFSSSTAGVLVGPSTRLYHRKVPSNNENDDNEVIPILKKEQIRFLGRGTNAIVRPGCVLVAPKHEFHHYYRRSAILIHAMGEANDGSGDYMIRGLILDHPTPFTLQEMMDHQPAVVHNPLGNNFLFRGGDKGGDGVILLHANAELARPQIGMSGLYEGGWQQVLEICQSSGQGGSTEGYKAFFNYW
jgi:hypothetical protein